MERKRFTEEEMAELRKNPYTYKVTQGQLSFTVEFKELFWQRSSDGETPAEILRSCGYAPEMLGVSRINGIRMHIQAEGRRGLGFSNIRKSRQDSAPCAEVKEVSAEDVRKLRNEVDYLKKEVEFLKKFPQSGRPKGR